MEQFDDILGRVLAACEGLDEAQIDAVLKRLMEEEGFNETEKKFVDETFSLLEDSAKQYADLQKVKDDGIGRQEWLTKKFDEMLVDRTEDEVKSVMETIEKTSAKSMEKELESAEKELEESDLTSNNE